MVVFAGLYFFNPRTIPTTKVTTTVNTVVTNTVFQEVSTKPSAETLAQIDLGKRIYSALTNTVHDAAVLFAIKGVKVKYNLSGMTDVVSENDIKAKFELALRRNNVPIDPDATSFLIVSLNGMWVNNEREMFWPCLDLVDRRCVIV